MVLSVRVMHGPHRRLAACHYTGSRDRLPEGDERNDPPGEITHAPVAEDGRASSRVLVLGNQADSLINFRGALIARMVELGHDVVACAPEVNPRVRDDLVALGARYVSFPLDRTGRNPLRDLRSLRRLEALMRDLAPQVVFSYTIKPVIYGSIAAARAGVPHIFSMVTGLGYVFLGKTVARRALRWVACRMYRRALGRNETVFFQNRDDMQFFLKTALLLDRNRAVLVNGSGVDLERFPFEEAPGGDPTFLCISRLLVEKGIRDYVDAARILKRRHPGARFVLLGPYEPRPGGIRPAEVESWRGTVEYLGQADDVRPFLRDASVYVLPSYREGTPRTVLEALATGRPVVTTDAPGCRETVSEGVNGYLVPVSDPSSLARAMERFLTRPELIRRMGRRSRQLSEAKYDVHEVNRTLLRSMGLL